MASNLIERLVPTVDRVRTLVSSLGFRQHRVYRVKKTWSGTRCNEGTATTTLDSEITPAPRLMEEVEPFGDPRNIRLEEVSLAYTEADLTGGTLAANQEFYYRVTDSNPEATRTRFFALDGAPICDRLNVQWVLKLKQREEE